MSLLFLDFYAGVIRAADLRSKRSLDSTVTGLELMAPVCRKDEDSHVTQLALPCMETCKSWLSSNRTNGPSFEGLACAMKYLTYLTK